MGNSYKFFFFYNKLQTCNNYQVLFAWAVHIQNSAGEFVCPGHEMLLFYKKDQRRHHNQQGRAHQGIQYVVVYLSKDGI